MGDSSQELEPHKLSVINKQTLVPISIAFSIIISFIAAWGWLNSQFATIIIKIDQQTKTYDARFTEYERRIERVENKSNEAWPEVDAVLWVSEFRRLNPEMKIPSLERN